MKMKTCARHLLQYQTDADWITLLKRSVYEPIVNGVEFPRFPHGDVQRRWVGSADEHALNEAFEFYKYVKGYAEALGNPLQERSKFLDFGCGWGRFTRIFWGDIDESGLHGVDIDPDIISTCKMIGVPGSFGKIDPTGKLPYGDETFDCIIAYSVFSHLPETIAKHWMIELSRVMRPGGVFVYTVEPHRFLEFIGSIDQPQNDWHAGLAAFKDEIPSLIKSFEEGHFVFLPTSGGGEFMTRDVYGDAAISEAYIQKHWAEYFRMAAYIDDPGRFWQAVVVMQKP